MCNVLLSHLLKSFLYYLFAVYMLQFAVFLLVILLLCIVGAIIGFVFRNEACYFYLHNGGYVFVCLGL